MGYYSDPTASQALGNINREFSRLERKAKRLRKLRDEARKEIKEEELSEDAKKRGEKDVDEVTKNFSAEIDKLFAEKQAEIMKI